MIRVIHDSYYNRFCGEEILILKRNACASHLSGALPVHLLKLSIEMGLIVEPDSLLDLADREIAAGESRANA
jgi:hypothetical protein